MILQKPHWELLPYIEMILQNPYWDTYSRNDLTKAVLRYFRNDFTKSKLRHSRDDLTKALLRHSRNDFTKAIKTFCIFLSWQSVTCIISWELQSHFLVNKKQKQI